MTDVFISYKREEREKALVIARGLAARGYGVWWDIDLLPGDLFLKEIEAVITGAKAAIVLWFGSAVESRFVRAEATLAWERDILIPARLDATELPFPFGGYQTLDLCNWSGSPTDASLQSLCDAVRKKVAHPSSEPKKGTAIEDALDRPREEAEFWRSISQSSAQDPEEYRTYIQKYEEHGLFVEIARLRISRLEARRIAKALAGATAVIALLVIGLFKILPWFKDAPIPNPPVVQNGTTLPLKQALPAKEAPVELQPKKEKTPPPRVVPRKSYESPESLDDTLVHQLSDPRQLSRNSELFSVEWPVVLARLRATPFGDRKKAIVNPPVA